MDSNFLRQLVWEPKETAKLDFKIKLYKINETRPQIQSEITEWGVAKEQQWAEFVKDIIALANGNIGTAEETGYLVVGADDKLKADGTTTLRNVENPVPTPTEILEKVNSYCYPPLPDLECKEVIVDGVNLFVISIPPAPYLYRLSKLLKTPKQHYSPHTTLIRRKDGEKTYPASPDEAEILENEKKGKAPLYIKIEADLEKAHKISKQKLRNKALRGYLIGIIGLLIFCVLYFKGQEFISFFVLITFACFAIPCLEEMYLYWKRPRNINEANYIGNGRLMEDNREGSYLIYNPTAACIYPCCNEGKIVLSDAPPMEFSKTGKKYIGVCTIARKDHSYRIDYNRVATPAQFDWSVPITK
jgi:Putative DNA-binding domain